LSKESSQESNQFLVDAIDCPATLATDFLQRLAAFCGVGWDPCSCQASQ